MFDNPEEMFAKEAELVNEDFITEENTYNLRIGGTGGFDYINSSKDLENPRWRLAGAKRGGESWKEKVKSSPKLKTELKNKMAEVNNRRWKEQSYKEKMLPIVQSAFKGKKHSAKTKEKMSKMAKERLSDPTKNSSTGTIWIFNIELKENRKIKETDCIPDGWQRGRKLKF